MNAIRTLRSSLIYQKHQSVREATENLLNAIYDDLDDVGFQPGDRTEEMEDALKTIMNEIDENADESKAKAEVLRAEITREIEEATPEDEDDNA